MFNHPFKKNHPSLLPLSASPNTSAPPSTATTPNIDEPIDPLQVIHIPSTTSFSSSTLPSTRRTKPPPLPISIPNPPTYFTSATNGPLTASNLHSNWNDPPTSWTSTVPVTPRAISASSTSFDINALYATANPRATPRRRQSSMAKERELQAAGLVTPGLPPPSYHRLYGGDGDGDGWMRDVKLGSISIETQDLNEEMRRRRGGRVARVLWWGVVLVVGVVLVLVLGVWSRGGSYTQVASGDAATGVAEGGEEMLSSSFEGWGFDMGGNSSGGLSIAAFGERCMAWGSGWGDIVPGFVAKYLSSSSSSGSVDGGQQGAGDVEVETMTQTIRLDKGLAYQLPGTMSRIMRGRETMLGQPRSVVVEDLERRDELGGQDGESESESGSASETGALGRAIHDEEAEARRVRAAMTEELWVKHAPVRPIHDVGHEGRDMGKSSRGEL